MEKVLTGMLFSSVYVIMLAINEMSVFFFDGGIGFLDIQFDLGLLLLVRLFLTSLR